MALKSGKLIICPTPIGNLGDMTHRAEQALASCDVVCCEDTRVTGKLLAAQGIEKRLERLDEATITKIAPRIAERVCDGEVIAYCSDAGMPGVSDPGQRLIDAAYAAGATVEVLPGPTAVATAYVAAGFSAQSFYFGSFFPRKANERKAVLEQLSSLDAVLLFYESPQRIASALQTIVEVLPYRRVAVCRELTKLHEEVVRGAVCDVCAEFASREEQGLIKGEIVLVIDAPTDEEREANHVEGVQNAAELAKALVAEGKLSKKDIVKKLQAECGLSRNEAYELVHN